MLEWGSSECFILAHELIQPSRAMMPSHIPELSPPSTPPSSCLSKQPAVLQTLAKDTGVQSRGFGVWECCTTGPLHTEHGPHVSSSHYS